MAILDGSLKFTGKLGNISFYKMSGTDKIIMRAGNGPSKKKIMNDPHFARTRENIREFGACSACSGRFRTEIRKVIPGRNIPCHNQLIVALKQVLKSNSSGERGKRAFLFSEHANRLVGIELVPNQPLYDALSVTPTIEISENEGSIAFALRGFNARSHLKNRNTFRYFRFIAIVLEMPDFSYIENRKTYSYAGDEEPLASNAYSEWFSYGDKNQEISLQVQISAMTTPSIVEKGKLMMFGVEFGVMAGGEILCAEKTFRGKIVAAGPGI